ncbi:MAG: hypothetical protein HYZ62_00015, partial [Candidatus Andersenbacteria bacterium]|nr:hypothetical protein [Candidatus Andersenbacteria bacterium]
MAERDIKAGGAAPLPPPETEGVSNLQLLKRDLYARDESPEMVKRTIALGDVPARKGEKYGAGPQGSSPTQLVDVLQKRTAKRRKLLMRAFMIAGLLAVFGLAVWGTLAYRDAHQLRSDHLGIVLSAPGEFTSGEKITFKAQIQNKSLEGWQRVEALFEVPSGFRFLESSLPVTREGGKYLMALPDVWAGKTAEASVTGVLIGQQNSNALSQVEITVSPDNDPKSRYKNVASATTVIRAVPIDMTIEASSSAISGERLLGVIHIRNISQVPQEGLFLQLNVPPGMDLAVQDAEFSTGFSVLDGTWELPMLKPLDEITRKVVFFVNGSAGERRSLGLLAGITEGDQHYTQREVTHVVTMTASELAVAQTFNETAGDQIVSSGQRLKAKITYQNTGSVGLKSAVVTAKFEGEGLNPASLALKSGAYNPTTKTITWTSATVPELAVVAPNQTGEITYEFLLLPATSFPIVNGKGNNNVLTVVAAIDSPAVAFYDDGRLGITSTGPVPPKVGEQTTYTLRFRLGSTLNDVGDVRLTAVLPDGVAYTNKTYVTAGQVDYNERTGEVVWHIPLLAALTGRTSPPQELHVQVAVTPGDNTRGSEIPFLRSVHVEGTDQFVNQ